MTRGILNSINTKTILYKSFIQAYSRNVDTYMYNNFKQEYINYKTTLTKVFVLPNVLNIVHTSRK